MKSKNQSKLIKAGDVGKAQMPKRGLIPALEHFLTIICVSMHAHSNDAFARFVHHKIFERDTPF
jgi:hypothetical protein